MTNGTTCPETSLLSQFLDGELAPAEVSQIKRHLATCADCRTRVGRMEQAEGVARGQLSTARNRLSPPASSECLSPEMVIAYAQHHLSAEDDVKVERHLHTCNACVNEVQGAFRAVSFLSSPQREPVPALLKAQVAALWERSLAQEHVQPLPRVVIQLAKEGLRLLERYLVSPLLDVREIRTPIPAYRTGEGSSALSLRLDAGETEIAVLAVQQGDGVAVKLTLLGAAQKELIGRRIFLRQHGRAVFSAQTDQRGELWIPRLAHGTYEVACHEIHTTFQLELRP
jgi:anti-sigma factor RsiW